MIGTRVRTAIVGLTIFSIIVFFGILISGDAAFQQDLWKEVAKTFLQLVLIGLLGTYAKYLFDQYTADRISEESLRKSRLDALNKLTGCYWQIRKALDIIKAHRSALSYGEQMRQIIDYKIELQRLDNEIFSGMYQFRNETEITEGITNLIQQINSILSEWNNEHLRLSILQKQDEKEPDPTKKQIPDELNKLKHLDEISKNSYEYIHSCFEKAAKPIRDQLRQSPTVDTKG